MKEGLDTVACLGTFNRQVLLRDAISSIRRSVGVCSYEICVADGGSTDGSLHWLACQPDVHLIEHGELRGAVSAYNDCFSYAVERGAETVTIINDDDCLLGPQPEIQACVEMLRADPSIGGVAFFANLRGPWQVECWRGIPSCGKGVVRMEALRAVAMAQGDPTGRKFWDESWRTYAADSAAGNWINKLGWITVPGDGLRVHDNAPNGIGGDALRTANVAEYINGPGPALFHARWDGWDGKPDKEAIAKFGGYTA